MRTISTAASTNDSVTTNASESRPSIPDGRRPPRIRIAVRRIWVGNPEQRTTSMKAIARWTRRSDGPTWSVGWGGGRREPSAGGVPSPGRESGSIDVTAGLYHKESGCQIVGKFTTSCV